MVSSDRSTANDTDIDGDTHRDGPVFHGSKKLIYVRYTLRLVLSSVVNPVQDFLRPNLLVLESRFGLGQSRALVVGELYESVIINIKTYKTSSAIRAPRFRETTA